ncbi:uncharacterized protein [Euwallacea similis]|uniref:uncharacterized protein n=1 Tax=Euwallacea similis TaxID=1736056 RepID=UPI003450F7BB
MHKFAILFSILLAIVAYYLNNEIIFEIAKLFSDIFISLLKLISLPLVFLSIVSTISGLKDSIEIKVLVKKTLFYTLLTTIIAAATLPTTIECVQNKLKVPKKLSSFILPICTTINMNACAAFILITVMFVAEMNGYAFSLSEMLIWIFLATGAAIGNAGVPMGSIDLILSPAIGGIIVGYEIGRQLGIKTMFCERVNGKSSLEAVECAEGEGGKVVAEASLIKRNSETKLPFPVISLIELNIKNYSEEELPSELKQLPITKPGSREYLTK